MKRIPNVWGEGVRKVHKDVNSETGFGVKNLDKAKEIKRYVSVIDFRLSEVFELEMW